MVCDKRITLGVPCGPSTSDFAQFLLETVWRTVSDTALFSVLLAVPTTEEMGPYEEVAKEFGGRVVEVDLGGLPEIWSVRGGLAHGRGLQRLFEEMRTPYGMFCDVDSAYVMPRWDEQLIKYISKNCIVIGSPYSDRPHRRLIDGEDISEKSLYRYQNFPNAISFLFDVVRFREIGIDFLGLERLVAEKVLQKEAGDRDPANLIVTDTPGMLDLVGVPPDGLWMLDTGFDLPLRIKRAGFSGYPLTQIFAGEGKILGGEIAPN